MNPGAPASLRYTLHPAAEHDLEDASRHYRRAVNGRLVARFLDEFDRVARLLVREPGLGTPLGEGRAVFPLRGFPYLLIYKPTHMGIRVLVVRHQHRDPVHGEERR